MTLNTFSLHTIKILILFAVVALGGFSASTGDPLFLLLAAGTLVGMVIAVDYRLLLVVTLVGGLVVSGVTQLYIPQLQLIRWAFAASALILLGHVFFEALKSNTMSWRVESAILFWALLFVLILLFSGYLQSVKLGVAVISMKGYLQLWGALFAIALLPWTREQMKMLPWFLLVITLIQIPFVLHQYFVLVPLRMGISDVAGLVPIDIVSGTFGGKLNHGGANAALTVLCFMTLAGVLNLWKNRQINTLKFLFLALLVAFPAFINSTKISGIYLLVVLFMTYYDEINVRPLKFMMRVLITLMLCLVLALSVISSLPENSNVTSLADLYEQTYSYNIEEDNIRDNKLSRAGTIRAWKDPVRPHRFKDMVVGYGIGSSRIIDSEAGRRISNKINLEKATGVTALAALLWETGILGVLTVIMLFFSAFSVATKLRRFYKHDAFHRSIFTAAQCSVAIMFISLGHKSFFTYHIGFQTLFVILFGYLIYWERQAASEV